MHYATTLAALLSAGLVSAYDVPNNLKQIYDNHKSGKCNDEIRGGYTDGINSDKSFGYCNDIEGAIFLHSSSNGGQYGNMDIDCDGENNTDGDCANDPSGQSQTAFKSDLKQFGINDLDANVHPYVVFGNSDYRPQDSGMEPLSVMAVVCGGQLFYGIWGDTNGAKTTGEASISLAQMCYPDEGLNGDNGHEDHDVLYIGFKGKNAVPGNKANWKTKDTKAFEESIKELGDKLVAGLKA